MKFCMIRLCTSGGAFEAVPMKNIRISLEDAANKLINAGYSVTNAKVLLIVRKRCELTAYPSGRLLIKTNDEKTANDAAEEIYRILGILNKLSR